MSDGTDPAVESDQPPVDNALVGVPGPVDQADSVPGDRAAPEIMADPGLLDGDRFSAGREGNTIHLAQDESGTAPDGP